MSETSAFNQGPDLDSFNGRLFRDERPDTLSDSSSDQIPSPETIGEIIAVAKNMREASKSRPKNPNYDEYDLDVADTIDPEIIDSIIQSLEERMASYQNEIFEIQEKSHKKQKDKELLERFGYQEMAERIEVGNEEAERNTIHLYDTQDISNLKALKEYMISKRNN